MILRPVQEEHYGVYNVTAENGVAFGWGVVELKSELEAGLDGSWMGVGWGLDGGWMGVGWGLDGGWMGVGWGLDGGWIEDGGWIGCWIGVGMSF